MGGGKRQKTTWTTINQSIKKKLPGTSNCKPTFAYPCITSLGLTEVTVTCKIMDTTKMQASGRGRRNTLISLPFCLLIFTSDCSSSWIFYQNEGLYHERGQPSRKLGLHSAFPSSLSTSSQLAIALLQWLWHPPPQSSLTVPVQTVITFWSIKLVS